MFNPKVLIPLAGIILFSSCVSKKKYDELQTQYNKEHAQLELITAKANSYFEKMNSLSTKNAILSDENAIKFDYVDDIAVLSRNQRKQLSKSLEGVDSEKLKDAKTLEDSINVALSHNLSKSLEDGEGIDIQIENTVVKINVADDLLFKPGSYSVNSASKSFLKKLADVINSEPSVDVIIEGHTDSAPIRKTKGVKDNWELSVQRATSIIRELQDSYNVNPEQLIASGRSSYFPIADNDTYEGRALNRRTRIVLLPNLEKFFALLLASEEQASLY